MEHAATPNPADQLIELLASAATTGDEKELAEAAWVLGGELAGGRHGAVAAVRRYLLDAGGAAPPLLRGFALAIEHLASGYSAAEPEAAELAPIVRAVHLRAGWRKVLETLSSGPMR